MDILETLLAIADEAGRTLLEAYGGAVAVEYKGAADPVTAADRRSNGLLVERLNAGFPGVPVVAEESDPASFAGFHEAPRIFFVDPLDGTQEFIERVGQFAVMIGLVEGHAATAGVVCAPALGTAWAGALGAGAWRVDLARGRREPVRASTTDDLAAARIVASRSHRSEAVQRALVALEAREVAPMGSAGLKGARVADGGADAYVDPSGKTKRWDACAVDAVVTAAGGRVSDMDGEPIDYRQPTLVNDRGLIVSNGLVHAGILARLRARHG